MRLAYADPPYPGQSKRHYGSHPDFAGEVDHAELVRRLDDEYAAWALSTSSTALKQVLSLCPADVRVAAWVKPFAAFKNQRVTFAWEPVIYKARGGAAERRPGGLVRDWVSVAPQVFRGGDRTGVPGTKPLIFCFWLFDLLGANAEDDFHDLFPGSGQVAAAWDAWSRQMRIGIVA